MSDLIQYQYLSLDSCGSRDMSVSRCGGSLAPTLVDQKQEVALKR